MDNETRLEFVHLSIIDILCWIILCCQGLSWALQGVEQCPWPPPTRCQEGPFPSWGKNVSRHGQMSPERHNCPWLRSTQLRWSWHVQWKYTYRKPTACLFHIPLVVLVHSFICPTFIEVRSLRTKD